jgi:hypothetical protein
MRRWFVSALAVLAVGAGLSADPASQIRKISEDPRWYSGDAQEKLSDSDSNAEAVEKAKAAALEQLAEEISVTLRSEIEDEMSKDSGHPEGTEKFRFATRIFVSKNIPDPEYRIYRDYPAKGLVTVQAYADKDACRKQAEADLAAEEHKIGTSLAGAMEAARKGEYGAALLGLAAIRSQLVKEFSGAPLMVDGEERRVEAGSYVRAHLREILGHLRLDAATPRVLYGADGSLKRHPRFTVLYEDGAGAGRPVSGIPLKVELVGARTATRVFTVRSAVNGEAAVLLENVPVRAGDSDAALVAELDQSALGLDESFPGPPPARVELSRAMVVAFAGNKIVNGSLSPRPELVEALKSGLATQGYETVDFRVERRDAADEDLDRAAAMNADYLVYQREELSAERDVVGLYTATCSMKCLVYDIPSRSLLKAFEGKGAGAESTDRSGAERDAIAKSLKRQGRFEDALAELLK